MIAICSLMRDLIENEIAYWSKVSPPFTHSQWTRVTDDRRKCDLYSRAFTK